MRARDYGDEPPRTWIVYATAFLVFGGLAGYVIGALQAQRPALAPPVAATNAENAAPAINDAALNAYRDILARDPRNVQAAISAANWLYDAQRYVEAIPFYQQALALDSKNINVSTDLGTALWYAGRPTEALAQYERSLALNSTHAQTLFNIGIVKSEGTRDYAGAIAAWEKLLAANPTYANAAAVRDKIADARRHQTSELRP